LFVTCREKCVISGKANQHNTMKNCKLFIPVLIFLLSARVNAQNLPEKAENERIYFIIDSTMKANNIPSLVVGIVRHGKLFFTAGFGYRDRESSVKVDENALFQMGSDTKKFTGTLVNNLVSEGKLKLNEPVTTYLNKQLTPEGRQKLAQVTMEKLLQHLAGIPNREPSNKRIDGDPMTIDLTEDTLINDLNTMKLDFEPGSKFNYSNFGYAIAGYICEKVTGQSYAALVKKYITDKYKMPNTVIYLTPEQYKQIAWPYRKDNRNLKSKPWTMGKMTPAGGIYSNVKDISMLMIAQMQAYQHYGESKQKGDPLILTGDKQEGHYGFGLAKVVDSLGVHYGHGGDLDGYASGYVFAPDADWGLILLCSSGGRWFARLEKQLMARLINSRTR
jgi:CubicO group peptidase (beta-lactamase class C family)